MKKTILNVPKGIKYISKWEKFSLPSGKVIFNKRHCNCGASYYWLTNSIPCIITSPRKAFLESKNGQHPDSYWFRSIADKGTRKKELVKYVEDCKAGKQIGFNKVPKILVTYDAFPLLAETLKKNGWENDFDILVDEMQCLFTDSAFKGSAEINFLRNLDNFDNVVFMSATPYPEEYLDKLKPFCNYEYVELQWPPESERKINLECIPMKSPHQEIAKLINKFIKSGFFEEHTINGKIERSKEAVFFVNSVKTIISICKKFQFKDKDVSILCSESHKSNLKYTNKDNKIERLHISKVPLNGEPHKAYTFVTKAAFEGVDFYSKCASTYIFASPNRKTLNLDISIDLSQILGRQRLEANTFKYQAKFFYQTDYRIDSNSDQEFKDDMNKRIKNTQNRIDFFNRQDAADQEMLLTDYESAQESQKYVNNYISVVDNKKTGKKEVIQNDLVIAAEIRAWEIQKRQFNSDQSVLSVVSDQGINAISIGTGDNELDKFVKSFRDSKQFMKCMKLYIEFRDSHPEKESAIKALNQIPSKYHNFYEKLGSNKIRALDFKEKSISTELEYINKKGKIVKEVAISFIKGNKYTIRQIKETLKNIYKKLKLPVRKIKASEIRNYVKTKEARIPRPGSRKRDAGYQIL